ncbi:uncharacterized protein G2W53_009350 [Senna tora]|uniref:Uncharacterized protein n=1 Tax=Senna tora TaxID=362788 RepID=A0A835C7T9_9FABA|nr:uncharacterized protein G2W53_009350 [Senna tora]
MADDDACAFCSRDHDHENTS